MIDSFDSRALRLTDCYAQRFMKAGTYRYNLLSAAGRYVTEERPYKIEVGEGTGKNRMRQHTVMVRTEKGRFVAEPAEVTIEVGDLVVWNCPERKAMPYAVVGDKEFFGSYRLVNECGYSHAFSAAGEYAWADAYGSGAAGVIRVKDPGMKDEAEIKRWRDLLRKGTLVMITDGKPDPREVEVVTGQTVFFSITKGPGISITDKRLLDRKAAQDSAGAMPGKQPGSQRLGRGKTKE